MRRPLLGLGVPPRCLLRGNYRRYREIGRAGYETVDSRGPRSDVCHAFHGAVQVTARESEHRPGAPITSLSYSAPDDTLLSFVCDARGHNESALAPTFRKLCTGIPSQACDAHERVRRADPVRPKAHCVSVEVHELRIDAEQRLAQRDGVVHPEVVALAPEARVRSCRHAENEVARLVARMLVAAAADADLMAVGCSALDIDRDARGHAAHHL